MQINIGYFYFIGDVANTDSVFLIQNMFPVTNEYVESQYIKNKVPIRLSNKLQEEIIYKANKVLNLYNHLDKLQDVGQVIS